MLHKASDFWLLLPVYPETVEQCVAHSRHPENMYWMNGICMNSFQSQRCSKSIYSLCYLILSTYYYFNLFILIYYYFCISLAHHRVTFFLDSSCMFICSKWYSLSPRKRTNHANLMNVQRCYISVVLWHQVTNSASQLLF